MVAEVCGMEWSISPPPPPPQLEVTSDASGSWGCGAWHETSWFPLERGPRAEHLTIAEKEWIPVILACDTWGETWKNWHSTAIVTTSGGGLHAVKDEQE